MGNYSEGCALAGAPNFAAFAAGLGAQCPGRKLKGAPGRDERSLQGPGSGRLWPIKKCGEQMSGESIGRLENKEQDEEGRAPFLLRMLINKMHVTISESGEIKFDGSLTDGQLDQLCIWGSANEDLEEDDPPEHSEPLEDGHDAEADCWFDVAS